MELRDISAQKVGALFVKNILLAVCLFAAAGTASAQQYASNSGYRVCSAPQTTQGLNVVATQCGHLARPDFSNAEFNSLGELEAARIKRESFSGNVSDYNRCVSSFINSFRRPGAPADSKAPDQAACAHSWAQDQATQAVREYGKACINYSNKSMLDAKIQPWSGECYPTSGNDRG